MAYARLMKSTVPRMESLDNMDNPFKKGKRGKFNNVVIPVELIRNFKFLSPLQLFIVSMAFSLKGNPMGFNAYSRYLSKTLGYNKQSIRNALSGLYKMGLLKFSWHTNKKTDNPNRYITRTPLFNQILEGGEPPCELTKKGLIDYKKNFEAITEAENKKHEERMGEFKEIKNKACG